MPIKTNKLAFTYTDPSGEQYELKAGGVLFYKITDGTTTFLMVKNRGKYEDFGGRIDSIDKDIFETISREVEEESNKIFTKDDIYNRIKNETPVCSKISKYLLFIIPMTEQEAKFTGEEFGTHEAHDDIDRTVELVSILKFKDKQFIYNEVNFRLKTQQFFKKIFSLNSNNGLQG